MITEDRKSEEFENDRKKWKIYFDLQPDRMEERIGSSILVKFTINRKEFVRLTTKDIENLKQDLRDLGKLRIIKQGKRLLEN